jgi:hypothetical protein
MKRFFHIILRFSLLPVLFIVLMETWISAKKKNLFKEDRLVDLFSDKIAAYAWVPKVKSEQKVLLLGSSTVLYGLNCDTLNHLAADSIAFINLGGDARDPVETYFILKGIDLRNVKEMYFGIDPWIFARSYYTERESYFYLDLDTKQGLRFVSRDPRLFPKRYKAFISSLVPRSSRLVQSDSSIPPGFGTAVLNRPPVNFSNPVHERFQLEKYGWSDLQFEYLQKIWQLCKERKINFHLFHTPKRRDFIDDYEKKGAHIQASFQQKLVAAGFTEPVLGSIDQLEEYQDSIFADAYHLNKSGQSIFSKKMWVLIKSVK